jgi:hypothetical protein
MDKISLIAWGNRKDRVYFVFEKGLDFMPMFANLLQVLGFRPQYEKYKMPIMTIPIDHYENFCNKEYNVDLILGHKKAFAFITTKNKEKLFDIISKYCLKV